MRVGCGDCGPPLLGINLVDLVAQSSPRLSFRLLDRYARPAVAIYRRLMM